jgi:hypothetical protein
MDSQVQLAKLKPTSSRFNTLDAKAESCIRYAIIHADATRCESSSMPAPALLP